MLWQNLCCGTNYVLAEFTLWQNLCFGKIYALAKFMLCYSLYFAISYALHECIYGTELALTIRKKNLNIVICCRPVC